MDNLVGPFEVVWGIFLGTPAVWSLILEAVVGVPQALLTPGGGRVKASSLRSWFFKLVGTSYTQRKEEKTVCLTGVHVLLRLPPSVFALFMGSRSHLGKARS